MKNNQPIINYTEKGIAAQFYRYGHLKQTALLWLRLLYINVNIETLKTLKPVF